MSGVFYEKFIDSFLLNHKFLRSITLGIIINFYKLIKESDIKFIQNNPNLKIKSEISKLLYERWLLENNS